MRRSRTTATLLALSLTALATGSAAGLAGPATATGPATGPAARHAPTPVPASEPAPRTATRAGYGGAVTSVDPDASRPRAGGGPTHPPSRSTASTACSTRSGSSCATHTMRGSLRNHAS